jgi:hypothetical protein
VGVPDSVPIPKFDRIKNCAPNIRIAELIFSAWFAMYCDEKDFIFWTQPQRAVMRKLLALWTPPRA